jgi:hypothetical protein
LKCPSFPPDPNVIEFSDEAEHFDKKRMKVRDIINRSLISEVEIKEIHHIKKELVILC